MKTSRHTSHEEWVAIGFHCGLRLRSTRQHLSVHKEKKDGDSRKEDKRQKGQGIKEWGNHSVATNPEHRCLCRQVLNDKGINTIDEEITLQPTGNDKVLEIKQAMRFFVAERLTWRVHRRD